MLKIISFSGIDGSGKTTQAKLLRKYLARQGKKVSRFHATSFSIANKILSGKKTTSKSGNQPHSITKASLLKIFLRKIALLIDIFRFKKYRQRLNKKGVDYLIADRYFFDGIINILFLERKKSPQKMGKLLSLAEKTIKKPDLLYYIKILPELAFSRDQTIDQGLQYLKDKDYLYSIFASRWNMKIINGKKNKEEIFEKIKISLNI